jgi:hypothetical protein
MIETVKYQAHEFSKLIPRPTPEEQSRLEKNIREQGLLDDIPLFENKVLDGVSRQIACQRAGVEPRYYQFKGTRLEALAYVFSKNVPRRHLSKAQIVEAAENLLTLEADEQGTEKFSPASTESNFASRDAKLPQAPKPRPVGRPKDEHKAALKQRAEAIAGEPVSDSTIDRHLAKQRPSKAPTPKPSKAAKKRTEKPFDVQVWAWFSSLLHNSASKVFGLSRLLEVKIEIAKQLLTDPKITSALKKGGGATK